MAARLRSRARTLLAERGADLAYGPTLLRGADLDDVNAEACFPVGSPACTTLEAAIHHVRDQLPNLAGGDPHLALAPMITASGRKPT